MRSAVAALAVLIALTSRSAHSQEPSADIEGCEPVRLDEPERPGRRAGPMAEMPVYDQVSSDLCYAYTASQLVDAWRFSHGDSRVDLLTSPVVAGIRYAAQEQARASGERLSRLPKGSDVVDSGTVPEAYTALRASGSCSHWHIERFTRRMSVGKLPSPFEALMAAAHACPGTVESPLPDGPLGQLTEAVEVANTQCRHHEPVSLSHLPPEIARFSNQQAAAAPEGLTRAMLSRINARLSATPAQPLGFTYCMNLLSDRDFRFFSADGRMAAPCTDGKHASVLIGRRTRVVNGAPRCEYLLRNSFGPRCSENDLDSRWMPDCESGQIWVDAESIARNVIELFWIPESSGD